jgi:hypothetical protein|tara:strand:- start:1037 stop:1348 length:312 start_codon:yes stop_codon:yes gene_type:complete
LLKAVTEDEILRTVQAIREGRVVSEYHVDGRVLSPNEVVSLQEEAKDLLKSEVWKLMVKELEWVAWVTRRKAKNEKDLLATEYLFYNLDIMENFLKELSKNVK